MHLKSIFLVLIGLLCLLKTNAANFTSTQSGDWDVGATWGNVSNVAGVGYPGPSDNATITSGKTVQVKFDESVNNLTINSKGVLTVKNNRNLAISGNYILNGTHTGGNGATSTFSGTSKTLSGIGTLDIPGGVTLSTSRSILAGSNLLVAADFTLLSTVTITNNGTFTMISPSIVSGFTAGATWVNAANSTFNTGAGPTVLANIILDASATGNTVNYYQIATQNIKLPTSSTYYNLSMTGTGVKSLIGDITVLGDLKIDASTLFMSSYNLTLKGNWSNEGTLTGTGTVVFSGTNNQTISNSSGELFYNMTMSKTSGNVSMLNNVTVSNILNMGGGYINGNLINTLTIGTSIANIGTLTYSSGLIFDCKLRRWMNATGVNYLYPFGVEFGFYNPMIIKFNNLSVSGSVVAEYIALATNNNGLPLVDGAETVYNTFGTGYYPLTAMDGLTTNNYDLDLAGLPFFTIKTTTRILIRANEASNWIANGSHEAADVPTSTAKRNNLTFLPAQFTLADVTNCTPPVTSSVSGPVTVCANTNQTYTLPNTGNYFSWFINGGTQVSGGNTNSITVDWGPTGKVGFIAVAEANGCGTGLPVLLYVTIAPTTITSITGKNYAPENTTVGNEETYSIDPQPGYTYAWTISGGTIITGNGTESVNVRWGGAGTGQISVGITNACGTSTVVKPVNIYIVINSITSGSWNSPSTWDCNCIPAAYNSVRVRNPHTVTLPNSNISITNLIADIGGTFSNTTTKTLTVTGDLLIDGVYTGTSDLIMDGSGIIDGIGTISTTGNLVLTGGNKSILSSSVLSITGGDVTIASANDVVNYGITTVSKSIVGAASTSTWVNEVNSSLEIGGSFLTTGTPVVNNVPNTVEYTGSSSQTIRLANYYNLSSSGTGARVLPSSGIVGVAGNFSPGTNAYTITGSTVNFNGTNQNIGAFTFNNLTISGGGNKALTGSITYNAILTLTSGIITTGSYVVTAPSTASVSRTSGYVNGNYKKWISSTSTKTFEVGTAANYTSLDVTFASVTTAGYITASSNAGDHPSIASTCLDPSKSVNVYYALTNNTLTAGTFTLGFNYASSNVDAGATPANFNVESYAAGVWSAPLTLIGVPSSTQTVVSGVTTFGAYQIAEGGLTITSHPGSTSVCTGNNAIFTVTTNGLSPTFQWQVNSTGTWGDISNGGVYSNVTTAAITLTNPPVSMNGYQYRCKVTGTQCTGVTIISNAAVLTVNTAAVAVSGTAVSTCANSGAVNITAGSSASNYSTITWTSNGTGTFSNANSLTIATFTPSAADISAGSVILTLTAAGNGACGNNTSSKILTINSSCSINWVGVTSIDWNTTSNWNIGVVPTGSNAVTIPSGTTYSPQILAGSTGNVSSITINSGATLTINASAILNAYGNITNNGTFTAVAGSTVSLNGSSAQSITGVPNVYNMMINNTSGGVSLSSAIAVKGTLSLIKGVLTTNSNLTINFGAGGEIGYAGSDAGSISGTVSGTRFAGARTHYIAAPFSGVTSAQVQATTPLYVNPYWKMYSKDFTNQNWIAVTNTTTAMPLGTGFSLSLPTAAQLILTGTYSHTYSLAGPAYSNAAVDKYILVGNPYPSTLDWNNASGWTKINVADAIYFWDPVNNRAASYVGNLGSNGGTSKIPAMQSFLVTTTGGGGSSSVSINNNARLIAQVSTFFRVVSDDVIRITLAGSDATKSDEAVIRYNEMATGNFDFDLDAHKIFNGGGMPSVYTSSGTEMYSINSYASVDSAQYIPVGAKLPLDGAYKLKIKGNNPNIDYILIDKLLGTKQRIEEDSSYAFTGLRTDDVNRFELQLRVSAATVPTGVHSANKNGGLGIYSSTKGFVIKTDRYAGGQAEIEILDVTGNSIKVLSDKNLSLGSTYIPLDMPDGPYLVKVNIEGKAFAGMIVLTK